MGLFISLVLALSMVALERVKLIKAQIHCILNLEHALTFRPAE